MALPCAGVSCMVRTELGVDIELRGSCNVVALYKILVIYICCTFVDLVNKV